MSLLTTPFGFHSTAREIIRGVDLTGHVVLAVRRPDAAAPVVEALQQSTSNRAISAAPLDLADLRSVRAFARAWDGPLDILVNNAGIMAVPQREETAQGHELQLGTNFIGHFALTLWLHGALAAAQGARVVSLSSSAHQFSPVMFDDLHFRFVPYRPFGAYTSNAVNPGTIATGLQKHTGGLKTPVERRKSPEQGAATSVLLAASPLLRGVSGRYFEDCNEARPVHARTTDFSGGVAPYALDAANAERLWEVGLKLIA